MQRQQVWDVPPLQPHVTEHQFPTVTCPQCQETRTNRGLGGQKNRRTLQHRQAWSLEWDHPWWRPFRLYFVGGRASPTGNNESRPYLHYAAVAMEFRDFEVFERRLS